MKYKYPRISNTLSFEKYSDDGIRVVNHLTDEAYIVDKDVVKYAKKLDGSTNPYKISTDFTKDEINYIINYMDCFGLIRKSDVHCHGLGTFLKTLWIPRLSKGLRMIASISNLYLMLLWLPVFCAGIFAVSANLYNMNLDNEWIGFFLSIIPAMVLHEFGHAFAAISYGAPVYEMGVMVLHFLFPGAYVIMDQSNIKSRFKRIQINAAGVEANLLLAGVFFLLAAAFPNIGGMMLLAGINNTLMAGLNLTFVKGLDGTAIISELLGIKNLVERANRVVFNKRARGRVLKKGTAGYAAAAMCYTLFALQLALPLLLVINVWEIILWVV